MFFVYDIDGLQFKGDINALRKRRRVEASGEATPFTVESEKEPENQSKSFSSVLNAYKKQEHSETVEPLVYAHEIMSMPVVTLRHSAPLSDAWHIFQEHKVRHLPILNDTEQILGIISDRDILRHLLVGEGNRIVQENDITVANAIRREVVCAHPKSEIRQLALAMVHNRVGCIPILIEGERLLGVVTRGDILEGFVEHPRLNLWG